MWINKAEGPRFESQWWTKVERKKKNAVMISIRRFAWFLNRMYLCVCLYIVSMFIGFVYNTITMMS